MLIITAIGIALVILTGVGYTNYANTHTQISNLVTCNGVANYYANVLCSTVVGNALYSNAIGVGSLANFTTNGQAITNTSGSNANYVYYILFMALVIAVVIGALVAAAANKKQG